ncbi:MAG: hypothetical protein HQL65_09615 [Magnetococcales bacterium]|nr:hypothetical protein [Magnetococcales bacterium]
MTEEKNILTDSSKNEDEKGSAAISRSPGVLGDSVLSTVDLPPEAKEAITQLIIQASSANFSGDISNPIYEQINPEHINKILDISHSELNLAHKESLSIRRYFSFHVLIVGVVFLWTTYFLVNHDAELYKETLRYVVTFLGGLGSGYGLKSFVSSKQK